MLSFHLTLSVENNRGSRSKGPTLPSLVSSFDLHHPLFQVRLRLTDKLNRKLISSINQSSPNRRWEYLTHKTSSRSLLVSVLLLFRWSTSSQKRLFVLQNHFSRNVGLTRHKFRVETITKRGNRDWNRRNTYLTPHHHRWETPRPWFVDRVSSTSYSRGRGRENNGSF